MSEAMRNSSGDALAARLFQIAAARAERAGRHLGGGAELDLRQTAQTGASRILQEDEADRPQLIRTAEADIVRLVEMAIENAEALAGYPPDLLGEDSYLPAKLRFCPCPPFC